MEEIYANVEHGKPVDPRPSTTQTGPRSSKGGFHGVIVLFLALLSVSLLAGLVGLGVHYRNSVRDSSAELSTIKANLTELLQAGNNKLVSASGERDLLNASLTEMTKELNRLQSLSKQKRTCPAGWRTFSCSCYLFPTGSGSWEKGRRDCRDRGADLVVIDSYGEQEFLTKIIEKDSWIGLSDRDNEGTWKWTDETLLTQACWWEGQPDNGGGNPKWGEEDCVHITAGMKTEENWNDLRCDNSLRWICEKMV